MYFLFFKRDRVTELSPNGILVTRLIVDLGPYKKTSIYSSVPLLYVASTPNKRAVLSNSGTEATIDGIIVID